MDAAHRGRIAESGINLGRIQEIENRMQQVRPEAMKAASDCGAAR
jgi:hypothetical protein